MYENSPSLLILLFGVFGVGPWGSVDEWFLLRLSLTKKLSAAATPGSGVRNVNSPACPWSVGDDTWFYTRGLWEHFSVSEKTSGPRPCSPRSRRSPTPPLHKGRRTETQEGPGLATDRGRDGQTISKCNCIDFCSAGRGSSW